MKHLIGFLVASAISAGLSAYGVSPQRSSQDQSSQPSQSFPVQPAPQTSNQLQTGAPPQQPAIQIQPQATIDPAKYKPDPSHALWEHITLEQAKKYQNDPAMLFVDARAKVEYDQGHIPGAIPMPVGEFEKYYGLYKSKIKKAKKVIAYCHGIGCKLSEKCAEQLYKNKGHKNVAVFFGGWPQWQQNQLPIEFGPEPKKR